MSEIKIRYRILDKTYHKIETLIFTLEEIEKNENHILECLNNKHTEVLSRERYAEKEDKDGVEIYEGDIISNPKYEESYAVEYAKTLAGYVGYGDDRIAGCYLIIDDDIEVIGNVHDNPELVENK